MENMTSVSHSNAQSNIVPFDSEQFNSTFHPTTQSDLVCQQDSFWTRFWESLFNVLIPRSEPKVVRKTAWGGTEYYQVYDPVTEHFRTFGCELETLVWLERRY